LKDREKYALLRCTTALMSLAWMVRCRFSSMKARTRAICQAGSAPDLALERRSISDCRIDDAVASDAFAGLVSRGHRPPFVTQCIVRPCVASSSIRQMRSFIKVSSL
jgi:hypothetical protein